MPDAPAPLRRENNQDELITVFPKPSNQSKKIRFENENHKRTLSRCNEEKEGMRLYLYIIFVSVPRWIDVEV